MSDNDVDAQFADIIAHWDDATVEPARGPLESTDPVDAVSPRDRGPGEDDGVDADPGEAPTALLDHDVPPGLPPGTNPAPATNPAPTNLPTDGTDPAPSATPPADGLPAIGSIPVWRGAQTTPEAVWEAAEEEHFEPGPTAPLPPQEDIQFWGIIVGLVGGPLLLLWLVLVRPNVSSWWTLLALGLSIGGFVLLVMRQPHHRDEDDPHDGAVV